MLDKTRLLDGVLLAVCRGTEFYGYISEVEHERDFIQRYAYRQW